MMSELSIPEKQVFGTDAKLHQITNLPIEQGSGALPADQQAVVQHLPTLQHQHETLKLKRIDCAHRLNSETSNLTAVRARRSTLGADDHVGLQRSNQDIAAQESALGERQRALDAAVGECEAHNSRILAVGKALLEAGLLDRWAPAVAAKWRASLKVVLNPAAA